MTPKISIILPVYNGEKYLRNSIDSIIEQTFSDWELIIVNDCSTDDSPSIINEYAKKDNRVRVINNDKNRKLPGTLNVGFGASKGEYLTWTSDDNIYFPDALNRMQSFLTKNPETVMVVADMIAIDEKGEEIRKWIPFDDEILAYSNCVGACFLYRRSVYEKIGGYDEKRFLVEDYEYWLRVASRCGNIRRLKETLYYYRMHSGSLSATRTSEIRRKLCELRADYAEYIVSTMSSENLICRMYYETIKELGNNCYLARTLYEKSNLLNIDVASDCGQKIIIYGAGKCGDDAFSVLQDRVAYYADKSIEKIGSVKNGVDIISPEQMVNICNDYLIVVAVRYEILDSAYESLKCYGVERCISFFRYICERVSKGDLDGKSLELLY